MASIVAPRGRAGWSPGDRREDLTAKHSCLIVHSHPLVRLGVHGVLDDEYLVEETASCDEAVEMVRGVAGIDVAIVDLGHARIPSNGDLSPREAMRAMRRAEPSLGIVAYGPLPERHLASTAIQAGASTYVSRQCAPETVRAAVRAALDQKAFEDPDMPPKGARGKITRRQREILQLFAEGVGSARAASELGLSEETVNSHAKAVITRLGANNRTHAVAIALRESLIE